VDNRVDLSTFTRAERWVFIFGLALFCDALIPWWYRIRTAEETYLHNGGLFGWGLVAAIAGFLAAGFVLVRHLKHPTQRNDRAWYLVLGLVAVAALVVQAARGRALWIGLWVALGLAAGLTLAGAARVTEKRRGWQ
jgi:hypothetical protein